MSMRVVAAASTSFSPFHLNLSTTKCALNLIPKPHFHRLKPNTGCGATTITTSSSRLRAAVAENVGSSGVPKSVPVRVAHDLLQAGHRYLDVRTAEEFGAGHAIGAVNVPYMFKVGSGMTKNPRFLEEVSDRFGINDEIIVGCQAGKRSLMASTDLISAGYTCVTDIAGGYAAWVQNGLPTESS